VKPMKKLMDEYNWKHAGFTVEATMLIPFLCFLLAVILQVILYLHDTSIFVSVAYEAAQKGADLNWCTQREREAYMEKTAKELLEHRRLAFSVYEVEASVAGGDAQVIIRGKTAFLQGVSLEVQKKALCTNPVDHLRAGKRLQKLVESKGEED